MKKARKASQTRLVVVLRGKAKPEDSGDSTLDIDEDQMKPKPSKKTKMEAVWGPQEKYLAM